MNKNTLSNNDNPKGIIKELYKSLVESERTVDDIAAEAKGINNQIKNLYKELGKLEIEYNNKISDMSKDIVRKIRNATDALYGSRGKVTDKNEITVPLKKDDYVSTEDLMNVKNEIEQEMGERGVLIVSSGNVEGESTVTSIKLNITKQYLKKMFNIPSWKSVLN